MAICLPDMLSIMRDHGMEDTVGSCYILVLIKLERRSLTTTLIDVYICGMKLDADGSEEHKADAFFRKVQ